MKDKNLISAMRRRDPEAYAELCEQAGYKREALKYYQKSRNETQLYRGAELAVELGRYQLARNLLRKVEEAVNGALGRAQTDAGMVSMDPEGRGMMGAAMCLAGARDRQKQMLGKVVTLEAKIRRIK